MEICKNKEGLGKSMRLSDTRLTEEKSGWISVKDSLPKVAGGSVLVSAIRKGWICENIFIAFIGYRDLNWYTLDIQFMESPPNNQVSRNLIVTHWMPLPQAPESEVYDENKIR